MGLKLVRVLSVQSVYFCNAASAEKPVLSNSAMSTRPFFSAVLENQRCSLLRTLSRSVGLTNTRFLLRFLYPRVFSNSRTGYRVGSPTENVVQPSTHSSYRSVCEKLTELMLVHVGSCRHIFKWKIVNVPSGAVISPKDAWTIL